MPDLIAGELVAAAVVDARVWDAQGNMSPDGLYLTGQPGPALPFVLFRAWKIPVGTVLEEVRLFGPVARFPIISQSTASVRSLSIRSLKSRIWLTFNWSCSVWGTRKSS